MIIPKKEEIRQRREAMGLTKCGLSRKAGLSTSALYRIESGESGYVHPIRARAIATVLGCELEEIFTVR
ncbi:helix-turn-helix transcriptional regulator [Acetatifactor muris]|uniref:helix-turn-helix transcriptional regulator n=1 Tax=Acetatifactor muris TaxID=879566 RepID=UPI0023F1AFF8|nr:helix-turn-helix transcriptional regulator [Acetatifactor muris]